MNVEIGSVGISRVMHAEKRHDGKIEVHANVEFWWANHDNEEATVGKVPAHFTNPKHFHDTEAEIRPPLIIPPGETGGTSQKSPLLVVMVFDAPPSLDQDITAELLKQEGMKIELRRESGAQATWRSSGPNAE